MRLSRFTSHVTGPTRSSVDNCANIHVRSKLRCRRTRISATSCFHCPRFHHVVADLWIADLDRRCSARLAERAGCREGVGRRHLAVGDPSTAFHCRRHRHLPIPRPGDEARKIRWSETPNRDCFDCASAASTSEVGCQAPKRLKKHQVTSGTVIQMSSLLSAKR